jgi:hypothetical protein
LTLTPTRSRYVAARARAIDTHWRDQGERMYSAGYNDGLQEEQRRRQATTAEQERLKEMELDLVVSPPEITH